MTDVTPLDRVSAALAALSDAELKAIVDTAHAMGRRVAAHAHGLDGINAAIVAGVDSLARAQPIAHASLGLTWAART